MTRLLPFYLLLLTNPACVSSGPAKTASPSWCFQTFSRSEGVLLSDVEVAPVQARFLATANRLLANRSVVKLTAGLAPTVGVPATTRLDEIYLVRGSVTIPPGATTEDIARAAMEDVRYEVYWSEESKALTMLTYQSVPGAREAHNIALIVRTSKPVASAHLGCGIMS